MYYLNGFTVPIYIKIMHYSNYKEHIYTLKELDKFKRNIKLVSVIKENIKKK